jgi:hypothetical protein
MRIAIAPARISNPIATSRYVSISMRPVLPTAARAHLRELHPPARLRKNVTMPAKKALTGAQAIGLAGERDSFPYIAIEQRHVHGTGYSINSRYKSNREQLE